MLFEAFNAGIKAATLKEPPGLFPAEEEKPSVPERLFGELIIWVYSYV
jgi:hypothetical protein